MRKALYQLAITAALLNTAALADDWSKNFTISGKADLRVDANDGSVTIHTWDRKEIQCKVTTTVWKIALGEVQVVDRQMGDRVELEVRIPHRPFVMSIGRRAVHVDLLVPRELRSDIHTGDGAITVSAMRGETHLHTGDGHIEATSLDGSLEAQTGDGHIKVQGRFDVLTLHTGDGSIEADVQPGSKMAAEWNVRTGDGHVTVRLASDFSAQLEVHTGDGGIKSDLPVLVSGSHHDHELRGKLNAGGLPLTIRTNDGTIRLERL